MNRSVRLATLASALLLGACAQGPGASPEASAGGTSAGGSGEPATPVVSIPTVIVTEPESVTPVPERPRVEIAFVLDTTGSMGGLIASAKRKIWAIANEIVSAKPTPEIRIGLVGFRDRGDAYITTVSDLDSDLDRIYNDLNAYQAGGGGDGPESVNEALRTAVDTLTWTAEDDVLKVIFLVGDAPPHMDYDQDERYPSVCERAVRKGLVINTLRCGGSQDTTRVWTEIALLSEGRYAAIPQQSEAVATPYDARLAELGSAMGETYVVYGDDVARRESLGRLKASEGLAVGAAASSAPDAVSADRAVLMAKTGRVGEKDLVDAFEAGTLALEGMDEDEMPVEMRDLPAKERKEYVAKRAAERKRLQAELAELEKKRAAFLKEVEKKSGGKTAFDKEVGDMLRRQAEKKGFRFEDE